MRLLAPLLFLALLIFPFQVHASNIRGCVSNGQNSYFCDFEAQAKVAASHIPIPDHYKGCVKSKDIERNQNARFYGVFIIIKSGTCGYGYEPRLGIGQAHWKQDSVCVAPDEWDDPTQPGECLNEQKCLERNANSTFQSSGGSSRYWCAAGCQRGFVGPTIGVSNLNSSELKYNGTVQYTGKSCEVPAQQPPLQEVPREVAEKKPDPNHCEPFAGQTACLKPNGDVCATASTGRRICWKPHEAGQKTDGDIVQQKKPGNVDPPEMINLPNGDTARREGQAMKLEQTIGGRTSITTITNYRTESGANAGSENSGESSGGTSGNDGDGKDGDGSASGGESCDSPPVMSGDPVNMMIARQAWETRCAVERLSDEPGWSKGDKPSIPEDDFDKGDVTRFGLGLTPEMLDRENIFGAGRCPVFRITIFEQEFSSEQFPFWCRLVAIMRAVILLMGAYFALQILFGGNK